MQWANFRRAEAREVHTIPINDLVAHLFEHCVCGPTVEPVPLEDGSMNWLITHHSLDGREKDEN